MEKAHTQAMIRITIVWRAGGIEDLRPHDMALSPTAV